MINCKKGKLDLIKLISLLVNAILIGKLLIYYGINHENGIPNQMPKDFNFRMEIFDKSYTIDTYNNILRKSLDWERDTLIEFNFPLHEKQAIYAYLKEIDIFQYPENYAPVTHIRISPSLPFSVSYTINGVEHKIDWKEHTESDTQDAKKLRKLFIKVFDFIEKDSIVKRLPDSKRAYL